MNELLEKYIQHPLMNLGDFYRLLNAYGSKVKRVYENLEPIIDTLYGPEPTRGLLHNIHQALS
jgi:hypothetical protein